MQTEEVTSSEARGRWSATLDKAIAGRRVAITRNGRVVAVLIGADHETRPTGKACGGDLGEYDPEDDVWPPKCKCGAKFPMAPTIDARPYIHDEEECRDDAGNVVYVGLVERRPTGEELSRRDARIRWTDPKWQCGRCERWAEW